MQRYADSVQFSNGDAAIGTTVTVKTLAGVAATIYAADNASPYADNVLTVDNTGEYYFYAANGRYTLTIKAPGHVQEIRADILLYDPVDGGAGVGTVTSVTVAAPAAGITSTGSPIINIGTITLGLANDLAALEGLSTSGIAKRTNTDTWTLGTVSLSSEVSGTLPVPSGGTGSTTHTPYAVICGGTVSSGAIQSVSSVGTSGQVLMSNGSSALPTFQSLTAVSNDLIINNQTSNYTLTTGDASQTLVRMTSTSNVTLTVPTFASVAFSSGTNILLERAGSGTLTIAGASTAVTVNSPALLTFRAQYSMGGLVKVSTDNTWSLCGDLTP